MIVGQYTTQAYSLTFYQNSDNTITAHDQHNTTYPLGQSTYTLLPSSSIPSKLIQSLLANYTPEIQNGKIEWTKLTPSESFKMSGLKHSLTLCLQESQIIASSSENSSKDDPSSTVQTDPSLEMDAHIPILSPENFQIINSSDYSSQDHLDLIIQAVTSLFEAAPAKKFTALLEQTENINAPLQDFQEWTLLHYSIYMFNTHPSSRVDPERLFEFIQLLIDNGANLWATDRFGRTPIYFASSTSEAADKLNERFWEYLETKINVNTTNPDIQPLHVAASLPHKYIADFIAIRANPYTRDKYDRAPLHCAAIHSAYDHHFYNVKILSKNGPQALQYQDLFNNYPLYYAVLFGSYSLVEYLTNETPLPILKSVLTKLKSEQPLDIDFLVKHYKIDDPIYRVPPGLEEAHSESTFKNKASIAQKIEILKKIKRDEEIEINKAAVIHIALELPAHLKRNHPSSSTTEESSRKPKKSKHI